MRITPIRAVVEPKIAPTVRAPLGITSGFAQGLGQLGQAIGEVGIAAGQISRTFQMIEAKKKLVDDSASIVNLEARASLSYAKHHENLRTNPDYQNLDEIDKTGLETILKQFSDEANAMNPEVAAAWKQDGGVLNIKAQIDGMPIKRDRFKQNAIAGVFTLMNSRKDDAARALIAGDTEAVNRIYNEINEAINFLRDNLGVTAVRAEAWKEGFENEVETEKTLQETAFKKNLREADERAEKEVKAEQEANFGTMVVSYSEGTLTEPYIRGLISTRKIDAAKGLAMITRLRTSLKDEKEPDENNPVVVGSLATDIELGVDVADRLEAALINGDIKSETYIAMKTKVSNKKVRQALGYINRAVGPGPGDKWTFDRNVKHAEAIDDFWIRVGNEEDPVTVAREIVALNIGHIRRTIVGLRSPRFLTGDKTNPADLANAKTITVQKYKLGEIPVEEFDREARLIKKLEILIEELSGGESLGTEMSDRIKQSKDLRKR